MRVKNGKSIYTVVMIGIVALVLISVALTSTSLARFLTGKNSENDAIVARFEVQPSSEYSQKIVLGTMYPGDVKEWTFTVSSNSEVPVKCSATITSTGNLPLAYTLECDDVAAPWDDVCSFAPRDTTVYTVKVIVSWDASENDVAYCDEIDTMTFTLIAEQAEQ